jgi:hypothetical protein
LSDCASTPIQRSFNAFIGPTAMDSLDLQVLAQARDWVKAGHPAWLVTVGQTWGSAPRPAGSLLCVRDDGQVVGSVSGGCVEDDLIDRVRNGERVKVPTRVTYGISQEEAARVLGMPLRTLKRRWFTARTRLHEALNADGAEG